MIRPRLILCGGVALPEDDARREGRHTIELCTGGQQANVNVRMEDVAKVFSRHLSPRLKDLLEIAAYVYTADCATKRGGKWGDEDTTEPWSRDFQLVVPVRDLGFWSTEEVTDLLGRVLTFLSDDVWHFEFRMKEKTESEQAYLEFAEEDDWQFYDVDRVLMFSGGLDSLGGAVQRASAGKELVLVSHRPVATQSKRQRQLFEALRETYSSPMIHVPVWINKQESKGREHTQRTRSFLYAALGSIVAESVRAGGVSFFENGIVSSNLPVADEAIRARASRTTHPLALSWFCDFFGMVLDRALVFDNPFLFKTKAEVVSVIAECGGSNLIGLTVSCVHQGIFTSKTQLHCGMCSQCIDRRIATLAAGQEEFDPDTDYRTNVFTGPRSDGYARNMAVNYARHGMELERMSEQELAYRFPLELSRLVRAFDKGSEAAEEFIKLHQRHGQAVIRVLKQQLREHATAIAECHLEETSMLAMVAGQKHKVSPWTTYADRITELLQQGLPRACKTQKPKDERHLQEVCDGILCANDDLLTREFPFLRWGVVATKPDWSAEDLGLWVELKYVRKRQDIHPMTKAIAEDITKYGDTGRRVLYLVYDPSHLITDEASFCEPVVRRRNMQVRFVR